jgi:hypothetical protein
MSRLPETFPRCGKGPQTSLYLTPPRSPRLMPEGIPIDVCVLFERLALRVWAAGHIRYSADAILHQVRWHYTIDQGDRDFKANNNWTAPLARWFLANHPDKARFFETRKSPEKAP